MQNTITRVLPLLLLVSTAVLGQHEEHQMPAAAPPAAATNWARARLAKSPRYGEWVNLKSGARSVSAYVVYPEVKGKASAVVVIHEIFGMSDWVQLLSDELAEARRLLGADATSSSGNIYGKVAPSVEDTPDHVMRLRLTSMPDEARNLVRLHANP